MKVLMCNYTQSEHDLRLVYPLYHQLIRDGVSSWFDMESVLPGQNPMLETLRAILTADAVCLSLPARSTNRALFTSISGKFCTRLNVARKVSYVIPVCLEACSVPESLQPLRSVDIFGDTNAGDYPRLLRALKMRAMQGLTFG